jgi:peptidoglycan endopeptidase LytE
MNLKKNLDISLFLAFFAVIFVISVNGQQRARVVPSQPNTPQSRESQPTRQNPNSAPIVKKTVMSSPTNLPPSRPTLTNPIIVTQKQVAQNLVKKTASSQPVNVPPSYNAMPARMMYGAGLKSKLMHGINARLGIPYLYGSSGPNRYDCSGFIWSVFKDAGINFERSSAKTFWQEFEPVTGDERFQFGTLVFFNKLGHVGIVVDEEGFYHASSSKGITYSKFEGYWGKRIVGYRRIPLAPQMPVVPQMPEDLD